jgi:hypothetical protein
MHTARGGGGEGSERVAGERPRGKGAGSVLYAARFRATASRRRYKSVAKQNSRGRHVMADSSASVGRRPASNFSCGQPMRIIMSGRYG